MARKQLNIRLDEEIHTKAKIIAILKGSTLNDFIEKAILEALKKENSDVISSQSIGSKKKGKG
ncbi:type II toxin-antitoxin system HicB family antitoxin [Candidatus Woesearchaeota archaeon]|nr:type II toxin-antitoxin system HicB family antitoxin [Candidatus Woesearchaeota archaeon]